MWIQAYLADVAEALVAKLGAEVSLHNELGSFGVVRDESVALVRVCVGQAHEAQIGNLSKEKEKKTKRTVLDLSGGLPPSRALFSHLDIKRLLRYHIRQGLLHQACD